MADIFYDNRIYVGVMQKHLIGDDATYMSLHTSYPVQSPHTFTDGQDVTGLHELRPECGSPYCECANGNKPYCKIEFNTKCIAIPTEPPTTEPVNKSYKLEGIEKEAGLCTATFKGEITKPVFLVLLDYIDDMKKRGWYFITHERTDLSK